MLLCLMDMLVSLLLLSNLLILVVFKSYYQQHQLRRKLADLLRYLSYKLVTFHAHFNPLFGVSHLH